MLVFHVLFISQSIIASVSSSIGSDSESLLSCSKFHFEEKILEKLVRLEHKMEVNEEEMKKWEDTFSSKLNKMDEAIKQTEIFVESMRDTNLQEQLRLNNSYQEIVERFLIHLKNETELYGEQMKVMLGSLTLKIQEFGVAEKKRGTSLELMQNTLNQEQKRFNESFDLISENFRVASNETVHELIVKQQKGFDALLKKRHIVAFSAYRIHTQTLLWTSEYFKFDHVWTNIGNGYDPKIGVFTAPHPGVYHFSVVALSVHDKNLYLQLYHNKNSTSGSWVTGSGYKTGTMNVLLNLQKRDKVFVRGTGGSALYSDNSNYATFSGYLIAQGHTSVWWGL